MEQAQYDNKVIEFLQNNGIRAAKNDPTNIFQSKLKKALVKKTKPFPTLNTKGN
jgi:hypothetical protein